MNMTPARLAVLTALSESDSTHMLDAYRGRSTHRYRVVRALNEAGLIERSGDDGQYLRRTPAGTRILDGQQNHGMVKRGLGYEERNND